MSTYIAKTDYLSDIRAANLDKLIDDTDSILDSAEDTALSMIRSYLKEKFDLDAEFALSGSNRDHMTMKIVRYLVLHDLFDRVPSRKKPESVSENFEFAVDWLEKVSRNAIPCNLTKLEDADGNKKLSFRFGNSENPRTH